MPKIDASALLLIDPPHAYDGILIGIDFGLRRIGVAVGQTLTGHANPITIVSARNGAPDWSVLDKIIREWQPLALIVGIPLNMDSSAQPLTHKARRFALSLKQRYALPVHGVDERLTSFEVRQTLFDAGGYKAIKKNPVDALAAKIMLESWMREIQ